MNGCKGEKRSDRHTNETDGSSGYIWEAGTITVLDEVVIVVLVAAVALLWKGGSSV